MVSKNKYENDPFNNQVIYEEGQKVTFRISEGVEGSGFIRGQVSNGLMPVWIIEIEDCSGIDKKSYPYSCLGVMSSQINR